MRYTLMKKNLNRFFTLALASVITFGIAACDGAHFEEQPESPTVDEVDTNKDDGIFEIEYDPVSESYVKELYESICIGDTLIGAYVDTGKWMFSGEKNTIETITNEDKQLLVWNAYEGDSGIEGYPSGDFSGNGDELIYHDYPESLFEERFHSVFGPDAEITHETIHMSGYIAEYIEEKQIYCSRENHVWDNYDDGFKWNKLIGYKQKGDELYLYDKFLYLSFDGDWTDTTIPSTFGSGIVELYGNTNKTEDSYVGLFYFDYVLEHYNQDEILDDYGTWYRHTFKRNDDGTYYWVSSEQNKENTEDITLIENAETQQTEKETLSESDVSKIYSKYFNYNNSDQENALTLFYKDSKVDISSLSQEQIKAYTMNFYDGDISFNMPMSESGELLRAYSAVRLNNLVKTLFGLDVEIDSESFSAREVTFEYDKEQNVFVGEFEENKTRTTPYMSKMTDYEIDGDTLYIYDTVLTLEKALDIGINESASWIKSVDDETFEANSVAYKHTFKLIGGKSYHWVSSEPLN